VRIVHCSTTFCMYIEAATAPVRPGQDGHRRQRNRRVRRREKSSKHNWRGQEKESPPRRKRLFTSSCASSCAAVCAAGDGGELCSKLQSGLRARCSLQPALQPSVQRAIQAKMPKSAAQPESQQSAAANAATRTKPTQPVGQRRRSEAPRFDFLKEFQRSGASSTTSCRPAGFLRQKSIALRIVPDSPRPLRCTAGGKCA